MMMVTRLALTFSITVPGVLSVSNVGSRNFYSAVTYKGGSGLSLTYEKKKADGFTVSKDKKISTDGSCAILCNKEGLDNCDSFIIWDNNGERTCRMGIGGTGAGNVEIYTVPLDKRPTTTTTTTSTTTTSTTTTSTTTTTTTSTTLPPTTQPPQGLYINLK